MRCIFKEGGGYIGISVGPETLAEIADDYLTSAASSRTCVACSVRAASKGICTKTYLFPRFSCEGNGPLSVEQLD